MRKVADLPNGHELFVEDTTQGRQYCSSEIGGGVSVWHTALVDESTLLVALVEERRLQTQERWAREHRHRADLTELISGERERKDL